MTSTLSASELARQALVFLDRNDAEGARALLHAVVERLDGDQSVLDAQQLRIAAATCALGVDLRSVLPVHGGVPAPERLAPTAYPGFDLEQLRAIFISQPEVLTPAWDSIRHITRYSDDFFHRDVTMGAAAGQIGWSAARLDDVGLEPRGVLVMLLTSQFAHRSVGQRVTRRLLYWARDSGMNQREIAAAVHRPQTFVSRELKAVDDDLSLLALNPREIHDHFLAGQIGREQLITLLAAYPYERGSFPDDAPDWAYVPGSADQLTQLAIEGHISRAELDVILDGSEAFSKKMAESA